MRGGGEKAVYEATKALRLQIPHEVIKSPRDGGGRRASAQAPQIASERGKPVVFGAGHNSSLKIKPFGPSSAVI